MKRQQDVEASPGYEFKIISKNEGEKWVLLQGGSTVYNGKPAGIISVIDITEKKRAEEELSKIHHLESLGTLAAGIAHDFNNILTGIYGNISLAKLIDPVKSPVEIKEYLTSAENSLERARKLTKQLLTFSKGGKPLKEEIDLKTLIKETVDFDLTGSNIKPVYSFDEKISNVFADSSQMIQVISNLTINAREAMCNGGNIIIGLKNRITEKYSSSKNSNGKFVEITIDDEGCGIAKENLKKIFDPYFTTKANGTGLGMATVFSIVNRHSGVITVESKLGKGTKFTILLPATNEVLQSPVCENNEVKLSKNVNSKNILVMDDDESILKLADSILTKHGFKVKTVSNGEAAIEHYKKDSYFIVIMDLTVKGGMGGSDAAACILQYDPEAKIIVSSGYSNDPVMSEYKKYGFCDIIEKPYVSETLINKISKFQ